MKRSPRCFSYRTKSPLSNSKDTPWVIIRFPNGINGLPVVYPCGDSYEETEKVRELIEKIFNHGNTEGSGHASS